jgi:hypothetical protein
MYSGEYDACDVALSTTLSIYAVRSIIRVKILLRILANGNMLLIAVVLTEEVT